ncbi:MAG: response regulator transcription factor [Gallionellaceae bacterium]|nr:MAG: response regulator transcription factor [Gallionellaceae bacterium]
MKHALIVEDLPDTQIWLSRLAKMAFPEVSVTVADCVETAHSVLSVRPYDLALVDLGLPDGNGVEIITALSNLKTPPVIVVTTIYDDDRHLFPALQAGAQGYLLKEQPLELLTRQLCGILEGHPPLSPAIARRLLGFFQPSQQNAEKLNNRERETLGLLAKGMKVGDLANAMGITRNTASQYVKSIYRKLNISSRAQAALQAARMGLID